MNIIESTLHIGVKTPFTVVHISDTHLTYADLRDGERKVELAKGRKTCFPYDEEAVLLLASDTAKEKGAPIVHTGDLIDFVSLANLERARQFVTENDCFLAAGNHEFSLYVGEAKEDAAYRNQSLALVQEAFPNDIRMAARMIGGVNFVALDNGYYLFEEAQLAFLKNEVEKGAPVILLMHTPLYEPALYDIQMQKAPCAYLVDVPEEKMRSYPRDRYEQQLSDVVTKEMVAYIKAEPRIKAILTGHLHANYEGMVDGHLPQIMTACDDVRVIEID
ncbi:MAG: metallophosphoesterase [Clostridia bacterium]|nr:metallophosphoesterase [Clostridia bacterium]